MKGLLKNSSLKSRLRNRQPGFKNFLILHSADFLAVSVSAPKPALRDWSEFCSVLNASQGGTLQKFSKKQVFHLYLASVRLKMRQSASAGLVKPCDLPLLPAV